MNLDWQSNDLRYLQKHLLLGNLVLFAGAGFSVDAWNHAKQTPPLGTGLAKALAEKAGFEHKGEPLSIVYDAARLQIGTEPLNTFLRTLYTIKGYAEWYAIVPSCVWYRIYTTNIDTLLQTIYGKASQQHLDTVVCPSEPQERECHFGELQCVHLHGHITQMDKGLTFTLPEFAKITSTSNPWYQRVMDDLYHRPFLFVGTLIEEPPFSHYLEARSRRTPDDVRPKSFVICPSVGAIRAQSLRSRNIVPIECTAKEFFESLDRAIPAGERSLAAVRRQAFPHVVFRDEYMQTDETVNRYFGLVRPGVLPPGPAQKAGEFFCGAEPTWQDIEDNRDGVREVNNTLLAAIEAAPRDRLGCIVLHGPAGSGKTTTMMRVAYSLSQQGHWVYWAEGEYRADFSGILDMCSRLSAGQRMFVFVDVLSRHLGSLMQVKQRLVDQRQLVLVLADRSNTYFSRSHALADLRPAEIPMPILAESDVRSILDRLEVHGFLGALRGKSRAEQVAAFVKRAQKQLLVAMREATSGKGFEVILHDEYANLDRTSQLAYCICSLAVAHGAPGVLRQHLVAALGDEDRYGALLLLVEKTLLGVLVPANQAGSLLKPRHRLIGQWISKEVASEDIKREATVSFLASISGEIVPTEIRRRSPAYVAYRGMINCDNLWETFSGDAAQVLGVYRQLQPHYQHDFLFWLQFGMAHFKAEHYDIAENFFNQSLAICPKGNFQTMHQIGILNLVLATKSTSPGAGLERAKKGIAILQEQIIARGNLDSYPYTAYLTYVARWYSYAKDLVTQKEWEELRKVGGEAKMKYPVDEMVRNSVAEVERLYLMRAVKGA